MAKIMNLSKTSKCFKAKMTKISKCFELEMTKISKCLDDDANKKLAQLSGICQKFALSAELRVDFGFMSLFRR